MGRNKMIKQVIFLFFLSCIISEINALKAADCEVCFSVMDKFAATLTNNEKKDPKMIEEKFRQYCKKAKGKDQRFCYYLGGVEDSATGILSEMSKPLSWSMPADKICDLRYEKQIDLKTVNLKKLKVRDLKKILNDWEETCDDCIEKGDFIKRIESLKPKYVKEEL